METISKLTDKQLSEQIQEHIALVNRLNIEFSNAKAQLRALHKELHNRNIANRKLAGT